MKEQHTIQQIYFNEDGKGLTVTQVHKTQSDHFQRPPELRLVKVPPKLIKKQEEQRQVQPQRDNFMNKEGNFDPESMNEEHFDPQSTKIKQVQAKKTSLKKQYCWIFLSIMLVLLVVSIVVGCVIWTFNEDRPVQPTHETIIERNFKKNVVYSLNYTIRNTMNDSLVRINYTAEFVVRDVGSNSTDFVCVLQKRSEEIIDDNGTQVQYFDQSQHYKLILKNGASGLPEDEDNETVSMDFEDFKDYNISINESLGDSEELHEISPYLPFFRFSLFKNGKIASITFPKQFERQTLGLLRGFIKLFSPLLDAELYEGEPVRKVKEKLTSTYQQQQTYGYQKTSNSTTLKNSGSVAYSGETHNTNETSQSESTFSESGELEGSHASAQTTFSSVPEEPSDDYSTYSSDQTFESNQEVDLAVVETFQAEEAHVEEFEAFINKYEEANDTYTMTVEELIHYVIDDENEAEPGTSRLLLNEDGSLTLYSYDKQIKILKANVVGMTISTFGYISITFNLYEMKKNKHKKEPVFRVESGIVLQLGSKKFKQTLTDYEKRFPPLTLKFTLEQIEGVVNLLKGDFIKQIIDISETVVDGSFDENLVPNILNVVSLVDNLNAAIKAEEEANSPIAIMRKIFSSAADIEAIIKNKGLDLLNPQNQFAKNLTTGLFGFVNVSYEEALALFETVKTTLDGLKNEGSNFLLEKLLNFTNLETSEIKQKIEDLIPADVLEEYEKEIEKAKDILEFLDYIKTNGLSYKDLVEGFLQKHKEHFLQYSEELIDLYFDSQSSITDSFLSNITSRVEEVRSSIRVFESKLSFIETMKTKILNYFQSLYNSQLASDAYQADFVAMLNSLASYSVGISNERGSCCRWKRKWYGRKYCANRNDMQGSQVQEQYHFNAMRTQIESLFKTIAKSVQDFMKGVDEVMKNSDYDIVEKFQQIQIKYSMMIVNNLDMVVEKVTQRYNAAVYIRSRVECGGTGNLNAYINVMNNLVHMVTTFREYYLQAETKYNSILRDFKTDVYNKIIDNSKVSQGVRDFVASYETFEDSTKQIIDKLDQITTNYDPEDFVKSMDLITDIFDLYDQIGKSLDELCAMKGNQTQAIEEIRLGYQEQLKGLESLSDNYLGGEISEMVGFLNTSASSVLQAYLDIPFCEVSELYQNKISTLFPDLQNFTVVLDMYKSFMAVWADAHANLKYLEDEFSSLRERFFYLFKADDYKKFINHTFFLAENFTDLVYDVSMKLSNLKEEANSIMIFNMAPASELERAISLFVEAPFTLTSAEMFQNAEEMKQLAESIVDVLSYDIIAVIVAGKHVTDYFQGTIDKFKSGSKKIETEFKSLCNSFINLNALVTQDYLNDINSNFRNIIHVLNETIFPEAKGKITSIKKEFEDFEFKSTHMQEIYLKSMDTLDEFAELAERAKETIFKKMQELNEKIVELIDKLEIGSLNSVFKLAETIKSEFANFFDSFPSLAKEILSFESLVADDFKILFDFKGFLKSIQSKVQDKYHNSMGNIFKAINSTKTQLEENSNFYEKFQNSSAFSKLNESSGQFTIKFEEFWGSAESKINQIDNFLSQISGNVESLIKELNEAKNKMSEIEESVQQRIKTIKNEFKIVKRKIFNVKSLIFSALRADLGETVMDSLKKIIEEVDNIVEKDIGKINEIANGTFIQNFNYIQVLLDKALDGYAKLREFRSGFVEKMEKGMAKIDTFLEENIANKFQKLKDGLLYIKSKTDLEDPTQSIVLYKKQLSKKRVPIFRYSQIIPTAIGTFVISLDLNYTLGATAMIELKDFRSVEASLVFEAALVLDLRFGYGIAYILEFGLFVRGKLLSAYIKPGVAFDNIIPTQLVPAIADVPELKEGNKMAMRFFTDLGLHAFEITVGFYIKHIWLKIIWIHLRLCFKFIFFKFCLTIPIPIGFKIIFKRHDFGYTINGLPILEKRIIDLKLFELQM